MLYNYYILVKQGQFRELIKGPTDDTDACDDYIELFDYDCKFIACISRLTYVDRYFFLFFFLNQGTEVFTFWFISWIQTKSHV